MRTQAHRERDSTLLTGNLSTTAGITSSISDFPVNAKAALVSSVQSFGSRYHSRQHDHNLVLALDVAAAAISAVLSVWTPTENIDSSPHQSRILAAQPAFFFLLGLKSQIRNNQGSDIPRNRKSYDDDSRWSKRKKARCNTGSAASLPLWESGHE